MSIKSIITQPIIALCARLTPPPKKPTDASLGDYSYTKKYITWLIKREMEKANITGLSIALVDDQQIVWTEGFGYTDKQANIKATSDTVYHVGSISKIFTATAAMQLVDQGKLDIDQPLQKYLPEFSIKSRFGNTNKISPRNLMNHHSGLPCNWVHGMSERHPGPFTEVVTAVKNEYMVCPSDYVFAYSNLGMTLLGAAIAKVSGVEYAAHMDSHLLHPLGMTHSKFASVIPSKSYDKGTEIEGFPLRDLPTGGLNSSTSDIAHFMQMVFADGKYNGRQLIEAESLREMFKVQNANVPLDFDFKMGLGWMLSTVDVPGAGTVANHGGSTLSFHSMLAVLPEHKLGVVVLSNSATAQGVVGKIATETLKLVLEAKCRISPPEKVVRKVKNFPLTEDDIRAYEGYFDTLVGLVKVSGKGGNIHAEIMGRKLELMPREGNQFAVRFKLFGYVPLKIGALEELRLSLHEIDGHDVLTLTSNGKSMLIGEKLTPVVIPEHMLEYVGDDEIINKHDGPMPDSVKMLHEDGFLIGAITFSQKPGFVLRVAFMPVADNELVIAGLGPGKGDTQHLNKVGDDMYMSFAGFELRKKPSTRG